MEQRRRSDAHHHCRSIVTYRELHHQHQLSQVTPASGGTLVPNPASADGFYDQDTSVELTAVPGANFSFSGFSGALTGTVNPQSVTMSAPRSVTAAFTAVVVDTTPPEISISAPANGATADLSSFPPAPRTMAVVGVRSRKRRGPGGGHCRPYCVTWNPAANGAVRAHRHSTRCSRFDHNLPDCHVTVSIPSSTDCAPPTASTRITPAQRPQSPVRDESRLGNLARYRCNLLQRQVLRRAFDGNDQVNIADRSLDLTTAMTISAW
jgi:hypothetical protein